MSINWKISVKKFFIIGALVLVCALSFSVGTAKPASAATSCYGGAVPVTISYGANINPDSYTTTSRCQDVNVRFTDLYFTASLCVIFVKHTNQCNYITTIYAGDTSWHVLATNVLDGTLIDLYFLPTPDYGHNVHGYVAV